MIIWRVENKGGLKMKKPERNKDTDCSQFGVGFTRGYNTCYDEWIRFLPNGDEIENILTSNKITTQMKVIIILKRIGKK